MTSSDRVGVRAVVAAALAVAFAATLGTARADEKTYVMKFTLPTINDTVHHYVKELAAAIEKDSGGRIKGEIYPASQLGSIPRQIEGVQFGAIQCAVIPPEFFVGIDERFQVLGAPGLVASIEQGNRVAQDSAVQKLMLSLGADKGLMGAGIFMANPSAVISKTPIRHLSDFKGKKLRIFASDFQKVALERLGATPVAMSLGDVLPAIQQGAIDGAVSAIPVYTTMHYVDAAKYVTATGQPSIFLMTELSRKWYGELPPDLQKIVTRDIADETKAIVPFAIQFDKDANTTWVAGGGELISLPPDEQSAMMETLLSVGEDVSRPKPALHAAYTVVADAAKRLQ